MPEISQIELLKVLATSPDVPGAAEAVQVVRATNIDQYEVKHVATSDLLTIYRRRQQMGRLAGIVGAAGIVSAFESAPEAELAMVVVNGEAATVSTWLTSDCQALFAVLVFTERGRTLPHSS